MDFFLLSLATNVQVHEYMIFHVWTVACDWRWNWQRTWKRKAEEIQI